MLNAMTLETSPRSLDESNLRPEDGFDYYDYVIIYVYNVMVIYHDAESLLRIMDKHFKLNPISIGDPDIYLGSMLKKM